LIYISKNWLGQVYLECPRSQKSELLDYAVNAYSHLVHPGERISGMAFAERIAKQYDCKRNPRNRAIIKVLSVYQWVAPPYTCQVCSRLIKRAPALQMGEYALCDYCAQENIDRISLRIPGFPQSVDALATRDGVKREEI
jgi:hypothetical protein